MCLIRPKTQVSSKKAGRAYFTRVVIFFNYIGQAST